jgi:hypothetical protein
MQTGQFPDWCIPKFPRECHGDRSEAEPKDLLSGAGAKQILRFAQDDTSQSPPDTLILKPV